MENKFITWESTISETFRAYCEAYTEQGLESEDYEFLEGILETHFKYFREKRKKNKDIPDCK